MSRGRLSFKRTQSSTVFDNADEFDNVVMIGHREVNEDLCNKEEERGHTPRR